MIGTTSEFYYETKYPIIAGDNGRPYLMGYKITRHYIDSLYDVSICGEEEIRRDFLETPKKLKKWFHKVDQKLRVYCNGKKLKYILDDLRLKDVEDIADIYNNLIVKGIFY